MKIDARQLSGYEGGVRRVLACELADACEGSVERVEAAIARALERGLRGRRAVSAFACLELWGLATDSAVLHDDALGPLDTRMLDHVDAAPLDPAQRMALRRVLAQPLAQLDEPITPRAALTSLGPAPRGPEQTHRIEVVLANGSRDPVGQHWATRVDERVFEVMALTRPHTDEVHAHLHWYGGAPTADAPSIRRLPLQRPAHHRVAVELDGRSDVLHLWVLDVVDGRIVPDGAPTTIPSACRALGLRKHMPGQLDA